MSKLERIYISLTPSDHIPVNTWRRDIWRFYTPYSNMHIIRQQVLHRLTKWFPYIKEGDWISIHYSGCEFVYRYCYNPDTVNHYLSLQATMKDDLPKRSSRIRIDKESYKNDHLTEEDKGAL